MTFDELLTACVKRGASDIHLHAGMPPYARINGHMTALGSHPLSPQVTEGFLKLLLNPRTSAIFEEKGQADMAYSIPGIARFRVNVFRQRGSVSIVMRALSSTGNYDRVKLPSQIFDYIVQQKRGIILVTGPTGSGKSTTLGAIIDRINATRAETIITIEDPIETLHRNKQSVVLQREIGQDAPSFSEALVAAMRQDPDVIMIGEIRDYATAAAAISAAQTGHLVLSTLHTLDTVRTVNRVLELFPPHERETARILFADALVAIISQRLLPTANGSGRAVALEILKGTLRVKELVKDANRTSELVEAIRDGREDGMQSFDDHLARLYSEGAISLETGISAATSMHEFKMKALRADSERNEARAQAEQQAKEAQAAEAGTAGTTGTFEMPGRQGRF
ncbi:twitching motility protein PilT [Deinobacterium chartae]|uniref:Twitching motility protein PilT n=1 Tax=Deinobacterium chartae TaxID=521158 RepID=A0A841HXW4_9DEIO|nr:PilT/PilU family type 4a pilus ATPase [Deinobacterium chartae]MBB6097069.1 twitching motility protein PilT [Deinobacterium chartae]